MFKKTANTFLAKVMVAVINLCIVIMLSQWTGAHGKGEASLLLTSVALLMLFCNMIGGATIVYLAPRHNIFQLALISNLWSLVVCSASYFILSQGSALSEKFVFHICALSLINSFLATNISVLQGKERIGQYNFINVLQAAINLIILYLLLSASGVKNVNAYITSLYTALLSCFIISSALIAPAIKNITFSGIQKLTGELIRLGFANQLAHIMSFTSLRLGYFLLNRYCITSDVGIYSNGVSLIESVLLISNSIAIVQYSAVANTDDRHFSRALTVRLTRLSTLICAAAMIPLLLLPGSFFAWLFGEEFRGVKQVMFLLAPGILCYNIALIVAHYFSGTGRYSKNILWTFLSLVITAGLSIIFISDYSIKTAALISDAAYFAAAITILYYFLKESDAKLRQFVPVSADFKWAKERILGLLKR